MNITDIDNKIINKVNKIQQSIIHLREITDVYSINNSSIINDFIHQQEVSFWDDMEKLNVEKPNKILKVTDVISDIINFIHQLISDGFAYVGKSYEPNKSIYFNVGKYSELFDDNCLNNSNDHDLLNKNTHNEDKLNPEDFALWKAVNNQDISWDSGISNVQL